MDNNQNNEVMELTEDPTMIAISVKLYQKLNHDSDLLAQTIEDRRKLAVAYDKLIKKLKDFEKIMDNFGIPKEKRKFDE